MDEQIKTSAKSRELKFELKLKAEQDKIVKLKTFDLSYFLGKNVFDDYGSQNTLVDQPILSTLQSQTGRDIDCFISWKSKWVSNSTPFLLILLSCIAKILLDIKWE